MFWSEWKNSKTFFGGSECSFRGVACAENDGSVLKFFELKLSRLGGEIVVFEEETQRKFSMDVSFF